DGREVRHELLWLLSSERLVYGVRVRHHQERVAVRRRLRDGIGANASSAPHAVLNHDRLAERLLELLAEIPRVDVRGTAGGERHDDLHRFRRVGGLREHAGREANCRNRPGDLAQQLVESHGSLPPHSDTAIAPDFGAIVFYSAPGSIWRWHRPPAPHRRPRHMVTAPGI